MAKLTIEIEENEFALYDYEMFLNGAPVHSDENFTTEDAALQAAIEWMR